MNKQRHSYCEKANHFIKENLQKDLEKKTTNMLIVTDLVSLCLSFSFVVGAAVFVFFQYHSLILLLLKANLNKTLIVLNAYCSRLSQTYGIFCQCGFISFYRKQLLIIWIIKQIVGFISLYRKLLCIIWIIKQIFFMSYDIMKCTTTLH